MNGKLNDAPLCENCGTPEPSGLVPSESGNELLCLNCAKRNDQPRLPWKDLPTEHKPIKAIPKPAYRLTTADLVKPALPSAIVMSDDDLATELMETIRMGRNGHAYDRPRLRAVAEEFDKRQRL